MAKEMSDCLLMIHIELGGDESSNDLLELTGYYALNSCIALLSPQALTDCINIWQLMSSF